jgi:hypothetical protein
MQGPLGTQPNDQARHKPTRKYETSKRCLAKERGAEGRPHGLFTRKGEGGMHLHFTAEAATVVEI